MADNWQTVLKHDPLKPLISSDDNAIVFFASRDLLNNHGKKIESLWRLPEAQSIVGRQQADGSWRYPGGNPKVRSAENYDQIETFRNLGYLVEMYGFNNKSPVVSKAAAFLFSFQTKDGDIRGILGNQYTPYYTAAIAELLIKAGYQDDKRILKIFNWLNSVRQDDGGWAIPLRTQKKKLDIISMNSDTLEPVRQMPSSHLITGVVLRAYAAHPSYRKSDEAKKAGRLLLASLFKRDHYPDRRTPDFWLRFTFPFWFTDLISALDSLSLLGFSKDEPQIQKAVQWFIDNQGNDGLWRLKVLKNLKFDNDLWLSLAICRIIKQLYS